MELVRVNELTDKLDGVISLVEKGEIFVITREGRPIAEIIPFKDKRNRWKRTIDKVTLPNGITAQSYIEEERRK